MLWAVLAIGLAGGFVGSAFGQGNQPAATPVGTQVAERKEITQSREYVGRVAAVNRVEIRARVTGFLEQVQFKEGDLVQQGAPLFRIEDGPFQAAVQRAQGDLFRTQGVFANASVQRQRAEELVRTAAGAVATRDQRVAEEKTAQGDVVVADAALRTAKINLDYTQITAPITGRIGLTKVTAGNVVGPDTGPLALMVSEDPIYVIFPVSQREFLGIQKEEQTLNTTALKVRVSFADGTVYDQVGTINFVDVTVDKATDTVTVRATIPNPRDTLTDGQFVQVSVEAEKPEERVLVPQAALIADQQGTYVFVVEDGKAVVRRLKLGGEEGSDMVVEQGLSGGELVVVQGLQALRPGAAVIATPVPGI